jgi:hypothetical protein
MDITIPEAVLLLALDDERGTALIDDSALGAALAGGAIAQLLLDGRVRIAGDGEEGVKPGRLVAAAGSSDERLEPLVARIEGRKPEAALSTIAGWSGSGKLKQRLLDDFAAVGVVARDDDRFLGLTWRTRWERGERRELEDTLQQRARSLMTGDGPAGQDDLEVEAALAILHGAGALPQVFPDLPEAALARRGDALAEASWGSREVRAAIAEVQAAMTVVLIATAIMPTSTSS